MRTEAPEEVAHHPNVRALVSIAAVHNGCKCRAFRVPKKKVERSLQAAGLMGSSSKPYLGGLNAAAFTRYLLATLQRLFVQAGMRADRGRLEQLVTTILVVVATPRVEAPCSATTSAPAVQRLPETGRLALPRAATRTVVELLAAIIGDHDPAKVGCMLPCPVSLAIGRLALF